jgi:hypothetical protein
MTSRLWLLAGSLALGASARPAGAAQAEPDAPTIGELWALVQAQQAEIDSLKAAVAAANDELEATNAHVAAAESQIIATGDFVESLELPAERPTSVGGYGELHYSRLDADDAANDLDELDFHRFVLFLSHRFSDRVRFFSELEVEHSIAGDGQPGEVELEQAYVDFTLSDSLSTQAGMFLLPIGILNETHEPPTFYGVERNGVESVIIPSTWWEAGAKLAGRSGRGLSWDLAVHSGLEMPTTGPSAFRVRSGRQKVAEGLAHDPAYTFRLRYTGRPGLDLSASYQYQSDPSQIPGDGLDAGSLWSAQALYTSGDFGLRALYSRWNFDGSAVEAAGADEQTGWYVEPSFRLNPKWGVYTRYEDVAGARNQDKFDQWQVGVNYWPLPDVVVKFDYRRREHEIASELGHDFSGIDIGLGYQF